MKTVIERLEYNWWNFHIKVMDESQWVRETLPRVKEIWDMREEAVPYLVLSVLGFPLGVLLGWLSVYVK
jgi:hypothetical protein